MAGDGRSPLVVVTGPPGAGKTTVCRLLAEASDRGLHLDSDVFYRFPAHPVDPSLPAARHQNEAVMRALGAASGAFASAGYRVCFDGILGPWFLEVFRAALPAGWPIDYVVLDLPLDEALARVRGRDGAGPSAVVRRMHAAFRELGDLEPHRCAVAGDPAEALASRLGRQIDAGRFRLP